MLFRPVYGPELAAIYDYVIQKNGTVSRQDIYQSVLPIYRGDKVASTQNIDDALSFLVAAGLITGSRRFQAVLSTDIESFCSVVLQQLQALACGKTEPLHEIDSFYLFILDHLFIKPNRLYVANLHAEVNKLRRVTQMGGISQEKIRSWKRVMTFLGLGHRIGQGFQCVYSPRLLLNIFDMWKEDEGFIQTFLEEHFVDYLPFQTSAGDLAQAVQRPLLHLMTEGKLTMYTRQDSSSKPYLGKKRFRYIVCHKEKP